MSLRLDQVRDLDCVASFRPLTFDLSTRIVTGPAAVLRRVLYRITSRRGSIKHAPGKGIDVRELEGATLDATDALGWRLAIEREASDEDFVLYARCEPIQLVAPVPIVLSLTLVDGITYPLEVSVSEAGAALRRLGGQTA
ncbi:MAG TPA: hypothetical protein PKA64_01580 [Myxococcota bacterium]|nr:hypothetical protein [Myxococcota bacterium]